MQLAEMSGDDMLDEKAGRVKVKDQGNTILVPRAGGGVRAELQEADETQLSPGNIPINLHCTRSSLTTPFLEQGDQNRVNLKF